MIQFISHYTEEYGYLDSIRLALEGGCRWIQLRMKESPMEEILRTALEARKLCSSYGAKLIIDDHVDLVNRIDADGVHLGKTDMPIIEARRILGPDRIIGGTANTLEDIILHHRGGANYIGCGPFRFTQTKKNLSPTLGLEGYRKIMQGMAKEGINLPVVAIGGITLEDIPSIMETGVTGIALSGTILRAEDPVQEMKNIINIINTWKN